VFGSSLSSSSVSVNSSSSFSLFIASLVNVSAFYVCASRSSLSSLSPLHEIATLINW
jgi:hypothetical protein